MEHTAKEAIKQALSPVLSGNIFTKGTPETNKVLDEIFIDAVSKVAAIAIAKWISGQRNDVPATGEEFANAILLGATNDA